MKSFKVICKGDGNSWVRDKGLKTTITKSWFGLIKKTTIGKDQEKAFGPSKGEICIVVDIRQDGFYKLAGTETQKEIAEKTTLISN